MKLARILAVLVLLSLLITGCSGENSNHELRNAMDTYNKYIEEHPGTAEALLYVAKGGFVAVIQNGTEIERFSLSEEQEYRIELEDGSYNLLKIQDGKVYMEEASCPDQICVNHRAIHNVGETIVCLPNELVLKVIEQTSKPELDMVI